MSAGTRNNSSLTQFSFYSSTETAYLFSGFFYYYSYQHKLDLVGSVNRREQQIQLNIHICMIRQYYYSQNWLHKHLRTGIHQYLQMYNILH